MKTVLIIVACFASAILQAQNYQINFEGEGESLTVDSVFVQNLTQKTELTMSGSSTLHLVGPVGVNNLISMEENVKIFPNPMNHNSKLEFYTIKDGDIKIEIFDIHGKLVSHTIQQLYSGKHAFEIDGLNAGVYLLNLTANDIQKTAKLISSGVGLFNTEIKLINSEHIEKSDKILKSTNELIQLDYYIGDVLKYTCYSGSNVTIKTDVPTENMTVKAHFVNFSDKTGSKYKLLQVGNQVWMAENMVYLPSVTYPGVTGSKNNPFPIYSVPDYLGNNVDDAIQSEGYVKYGVIYNWHAALEVCPAGWHLPTDEDWTTLERSLCAGPNCEAAFPYDDQFAAFRGENEGSKMAGNYSLWYEGDLRDNATFGTSGFDGPPAGRRSESGYQQLITELATWWSSSEMGTSAWTRSINKNSSSISRGSAEKTQGQSVRCVKD